jgi:chromosome segregation ATPase
MADAPSQPPPDPLTNEGSDPHSHSSNLELEPRQAEMSKSPAAAPWLHLEPDVTHAVISKTEEELLSGLSALMRNKVEYEKVQRQLATALHQIDEARNEHLAVKNQVRVAEDELAARVKDHEKVLAEIAQTQEQLQVERNKHLEHQEALFKTRNEAEDSRRALQSIVSELSETQETCRLMKAQIVESKKEITRLLGERESLLAQIHPIRRELDQRLVDRESIIEQVTILHRHVKTLTEEKAALAAIGPAQ